MIGPFQARQYDPRPGARRMADLGMHLGDIEADRATRVGSAWANGVQGVASAIGRTMTDLAEYEEQKPAREARNEQLRAETSKANREADYNKAMGDMQGMGADDVIKGLRERGFPEKAADLQAKLDKSRDDALDIEIKKFTVAEKRLSEAAALLDGARSATGAEVETYRSVLPKVRELVGEDLAKSIPDEYDRAFVDQAMTWGMSMKDKLTTRRESAAGLLSKNRDERAADEHFTKAIGQWLTTVDTQDEWDEAIANAKGLGASDATLAKFGGQYSQEAVARAKVFAGTKDDAPKAGSFEAFMTSFAASKKKDVGALSPNEQLAARRQWAAADWKPEKPSGDDTAVVTADDYRSIRAAIEKEFEAQITPPPGSDETLSMEARNTAMRWKSTQLDRLDAMARKAGLNPAALARPMSALGGDNPEGWHPPMTPGQLPRGPVQGPPAPTRPPVNFRQPSPEPVSSQQPTPVRIKLPSGRIRTFPSQEAADAFLKAAQSRVQ